MTAYLAPRPEDVSSDGQAFPGVVPEIRDLEIRDEDGKPTPAGTEGEICHGGPGLMLGYWRDPELTVASIDDRGVSRFGDLAGSTRTATCG